MRIANWASLAASLLTLSVSALNAASTFVPAGGNLQSALNQAVAGDTITLQHGATFVGSFYLPANAGPGYITVTTDAASSLSADAWTRVSPSSAAYMAKLKGNNLGWNVLKFDGGAGYVHVIGLEFEPASGGDAADIIVVGNGGETSTSQMPTDIDIDRCYIHGAAGYTTHRGIALNGQQTLVENSYISGITNTDNNHNYWDVNAIAGWNGPGPYQIINNYIEGATENIAFGGAVPTVNGLIPSNIMVTSNDVNKPTSWASGSGEWVKNWFELKNAQRVFVDNNNFTNNWIGADQHGFGVMLGVRDELGQVPWARVADVALTRNNFTNTPDGVDIFGTDQDGQGRGFGFFIYENNFQGIGANGGDGNALQMIGTGSYIGQYPGPDNLYVAYNTWNESGSPMNFDGGNTTNLFYQGNIINLANNILGDGTAPGASSINTYASVGLNIGYNGVISSASTFPGTANVSGSSPTAASFATANPWSGPIGANMNLYNQPATWMSMFIVNKNSGLGLMETGNTAGSSVNYMAVYAGQAQMWSAYPQGNNGYKIINKYSGLALDNNNGTLTMQSDNGSLAQTWNITASPDNKWLNIWSQWNYTCLQPDNGAKFNFTAIHGANCQNSGQYGPQEWTFVPATGNVLTFGGDNNQP